MHIAFVHQQNHVILWNTGARRPFKPECRLGKVNGISGASGSVMTRKPYVKPTLVKRGRLTGRTAQIIASGIILGE
ncbi:hypothetical protein FJ958_24880 [Mesorhizobium sp. B2-3-5]|nr:hypothetical protein FJ958_24880 [Mesorhizobium sp. B2-3-5]